ncbi:MAG: hypothetical protein IMY80_04290 [Chloroflexi bacterium]|nr:hypothetical protein [Chloroflexota bacterium]
MKSRFAVFFMIYLIAALQTIDSNYDEAILLAAQSPQPPSSLSVFAYLISNSSLSWHTSYPSKPPNYQMRALLL